MGASGAVVFGFFGAVFAAMTLSLQWHWSGLVLALPFGVFLCIAICAGWLLRQPGEGFVPTPRTRRVMMWSSIGESLALFVATTLVANSPHPEWLLPVIALIVGLHFLPIAYSAAFLPLYALGVTLILAAVAGVVAPAPLGGEIAGSVSALGLWTAGALALRRDWRARL